MCTAPYSQMYYMWLDKFSVQKGTMFRFWDFGWHWQILRQASLYNNSSQNTFIKIDLCNRFWSDWVIANSVSCRSLGLSLAIVLWSICLSSSFSSSSSSSLWFLSPPKFMNQSECLYQSTNMICSWTKYYYLKHHHCWELLQKGKVETRCPFEEWRKHCW